MSKRIQRINQLLKEELGQILLKEVDFPKDTLVTITRVEASSDLKQAKVYTSCIPEKEGVKIFQILNKKAFIIQQKINKLLSMKIVPKIKFVEEKETKEAARIEELLEKIKGND